MKVVLRTVLLGLLAVVGIAMIQDRLLYFPSVATILELTQPGLAAWPGDSDFRGLLAEPAGPAHATVVVFHGNAGHAGHRAYYAHALAASGIRVILAEYPGYGPREGRTSEESFVADARETIARAHRLYGAPLIVLGESLGAGVAAAAVAAEGDKVDALMLVTPWDSLANVAAHHYPWLPVRMLLRDRYDSGRNLQRFGKPVVVAIAERDSIIPRRFGDALYDGLPLPKKKLVIAGAEHNDWIAHVDAGWWREVLGFLLQPQQDEAAR
jgi:pimeloyl-ACP methyl ester carboxylesterase